MHPIIAVTSRSFSANATLRKNLLQEFPGARFNDEGLRLEGDSLVNFLSGAVGAIVGIEPIDGYILAQLSQLRVLSKFGVGLDSIDLNEVRERGIRLASTPGTNSSAVAELTLLLALGTLRRIPEAISNVRSEHWVSVTGRLLERKTVGLIGVGHVGKALNKLLQPFGCSVLGFDVLKSPVNGVSFVALDELLSASDVVCIHVPLTDTTRGMFGVGQLELMKKDAVLVNTSRGGVIDESALLTAIQSEQIAGAGLDVLENEPPLSWELLNHPKVFATPHIAGTSQESDLAMGRAAIAGLVQNRACLMG
jgi:phosphoglycerate dehydrogenase-like enzyme